MINRCTQELHRPNSFALMQRRHLRPRHVTALPTHLKSTTGCSVIAPTHSRCAMHIGELEAEGIRSPKSAPASTNSIAATTCGDTSSEGVQFPSCTHMPTGGCDNEYWPYGCFI
jgi:hypothetical protein